ncbi:hypothetical protein [Delftia phage PhiW-14]|uniref:Uncharacterized protein n=1 Tax=Delftia phage PhiW-14 TaxID=665032 RepID=C9DG32_BPW14|nr:hypothetical protein DP-phiW-14_gp061 [Delftia phage PhiW-14]ACV50083.1 hypothetical protein [Delftia phage PhiW-14]
MALAGFIGATPVRAPDVGTNPNQVPLNGTLGRLAFLDVPNRLSVVSAGEGANVDRFHVYFERVSDTVLGIRFRGYDGLTRGINWTIS